LQRLQALITKHQREIQDGMIGREVSVLFEKLGRDEGQMVGKSEYLHAVHVANANAQIGDIVKVRIVDAGTNSLRGEIVS
jgi:tRNA-2-methylthio-N6-dimethylallyladenosine synthase